jgi:hypothetical protein
METQDLQSDLNFHINEPLRKNLFFTYHGRWYESQITQSPLKQGYLGLEQKIYRNLSGFFAANPAFDKEEADLKIGFRLIDSLRTNYVSLALVSEDFTYDEKNDRGGTSAYLSLGAHWLMRLNRGSFTLFTEGNFSTGFERTYRDSLKSPVNTYHEQQVNTLSVKVYYKYKREHLFLLGYSFYHFLEEKWFYENTHNYRFRNRYHNLYAEYFGRLTSGVYARFAGRILTQESHSSGFKNFEFNRTDIMPAVFMEYHYGGSIWELGYMESVINMDNNAFPAELSYTRNVAIEKVKLGWTYKFTEFSRIQLSLSHVFSFFGFGGANIQMVHYF